MCTQQQALQILGEVYDACKRRFGCPIDAAYLYGSYARGDYHSDSDVDILTAKNAGIPCISVLWGFRDREFLEKAGAETMIRTPAEMMHFF